LTDDPSVLVARLQKRNLQTQYVSEYFIPYRMMPDRMDQVRNELKSTAATPVNRDFAPIAYYFNTVLWSAQFKPDYAGWLRSAARVHFAALLGAVFIALFLVALTLAFVPGRERREHSAAVCAMGATGFTLMALQIFLLLAFQSIYGYVYHQLAVLIALCMAGIAVGSWLGMRRVHRCVRVARAVAATQFLLALSAPALMLVVSLLAKFFGVATIWLAAQIVFPALAALTGLLGGYQFPQATAMYLGGNSGQRRLGVLYAVDLAGGCAGALVLSAYLIPVFGFWRTAWLCVVINLPMASLAARVSWKAAASGT
jgi:spermidine synthase